MGRLDGIYEDYAKNHTFDSERTKSKKWEEAIVKKYGSMKAYKEWSSKKSAEGRNKKT